MVQGLMQVNMSEFSFGKKEVAACQFAPVTLINGKILILALMCAIIFRKDLVKIFG